MTSSASVAARAALIGVFALPGACQQACNDNQQAGEPREVARETVGDVELVLSAEVLEEHLGVRVGMGSGRDPIPRDIDMPEDRWLPRPVVTARRGDDEVPVVNQHPNPTHWWRVQDMFDEQSDANEALEALEADVCSHETALVYRMRSETYDSEWHGVIVAGDRALHVAIGEAPSSCAAALAELGTVEDAARRLIVSQGSSCDRVWSMGAEIVTLECIAGCRPDVEAHVPEQIGDAIGEGAAHDPDLEAALFALFAADATSAPHLQAQSLLRFTRTAERQRAFVTDQIARCRAPGAGCAAHAWVSRLASGLEPADCGAALEAGLSEPSNLARAGLAMQVLECAEPARAKELALAAFRAPATDTPRVCPTHAYLRTDHRGVCQTRSLHRALAQWLVHHCDDDVVAAAAGLVQGVPIPTRGRSRFVEDSQEAALRVLGICAPDRLDPVLAAAELHDDQRASIRARLVEPVEPYPEAE